MTDISARRHSFTLIELLVVVAIITILASILLPSLNTARSKARSMACLSNVRQIGIAMYLYTPDNGDLYPRGFLTAGVYGNGWAGEVFPYVGGRGALSCPDDPTKPSGVLGKLSFYYNLNLAGRAGSPFNTDLGSSWKTSKLTDPFRTVVIWECSNSLAEPENPNETRSASYNGWHIRGGIPQSGVLDLMAGGGWATAPYDGRHLRGANYAAADGHAEWLRPRGGNGVSGGETAGLISGQGSGLQSEGTQYKGDTRHALTMSPR